LADGPVIVGEIASAIGLAEGEAGVRSVVAALARLEPVSIAKVSRASRLPAPIVASVCGELRKRGLVAHERPARLTAAGRDVFGGVELRLPSTTCTACDGRGGSLPRELAPAVRDVARLARAAPPPRFELDQCHCTVETKLRRVLALHEADALVGRRILVLGDDDLVSLALERVVRRLGSARTIANLTVLDVDPAVVRFVRERLARARFPVSCLAHDLREPLPPALVGSFDTVVTDPPYTALGARLFLSRAVDTLRPGGSIFLSFGASRRGVFFRVQQELTEMGLAIEALTPDFNRYVGAGVLGGTSDLVRLRASASVRPLVTGHVAGPLYTADVRRRGAGPTLSRSRRLGQS